MSGMSPLTHFIFEDTLQCLGYFLSFCFQYHGPYPILSRHFSELHGHISVSRSLSAPPMSGSINEVWSVKILIEMLPLPLQFPVSSIFAEPSSLLNWATITHQFLCDLLNGLHIVAFSGYLCIFNKLLHVATIISSSWPFHFIIFLYVQDDCPFFHSCWLGILEIFH